MTSRGFPPKAWSSESHTRAVTVWLERATPFAWRSSAESGDKRKARKLLAQALQEKGEEEYLHEIGFARVYVALGDKDEALKWLEQAYEHHNYTLYQLKIVDPAWDPLRSDPRFQDLVRRMAFPQ